MTRCYCGTPLYSAVGETFIISPEGELSWMRRRADSLTCPKCGERYLLAELLGMVDQEQVISQPPPERLASA